MNKKDKKELISTNLDKMFPSPKCELTYNKDYELLIKVMLSAQTTDKRVNEVTKDLFMKYDTLEKLNELSIEQIENTIKSIGMYKQKSKHFKEITSELIKLGGKVPNDRETLEKLSGIGRKTTNVVLSELYNEPAIAVDTHVFRVSKRLNITKENDDVLTTEKKLMKFFKKEEWAKTHKQLVLFGRYKCKAKNPDCENCPFTNICKYNNLKNK